MEKHQNQSGLFDAAGSGANTVASGVNIPQRRDTTRCAPNRLSSFSNILDQADGGIVDLNAAEQAQTGGIADLHQQT
eukprot:GSA25T00004738001.1